MQTLLTGWRLLRPMMKRAGPYMLIELLLPGGTLLALILFIARSGALTALQPMAVAAASTERLQCYSCCSRLRMTAPLTKLNAGGVQGAQHDTFSSRRLP